MPNVLQQYCADWLIRPKAQTCGQLASLCVRCRLSELHLLTILFLELLTFSVEFGV
jgi:hypothetical protein